MYRTHLLHEPVLDIDENLSRLSIALDQHVKRVTVLYPSEQTCTRRQGSDRVGLNAQMPFGSLLVGGEQSVDQTEQLHDSLVLS
jgi:hypothetical protein